MPVTARRSSYEWATLATGAEQYGVSERTLRRYIAAGELPAYRLGPRQIRIKLADLDALMTPIPTAAYGGGPGDA